MEDQREEKPTNSPQDSVKFIALGGEEDVTRNMYLYEYKDQILIVDCGLGFLDETMLVVDLLLHDISYLLSSKKKIVVMLLTHGHVDHFLDMTFIITKTFDLLFYVFIFTRSFDNIY